MRGFFRFDYLIIYIPASAAAGSFGEKEGGVMYGSGMQEARGRSDIKEEWEGVGKELWVLGTYVEVCNCCVEVNIIFSRRCVWGGRRESEWEKK